MCIIGQAEAFTLTAALLEGALWLRLRLLGEKRSWSWPAYKLVILQSHFGAAGELKRDRLGELGPAP